MKIFIIEDDVTIRESFKIELEKWDFTVTIAEEFNTIDQLSLIHI